MERNKGIWICFEGGDGSGKSTLTKLLYDKYVELNYQCILTREPGGVPLAEDIRDILLNNGNCEMDDRTEAILFAASRRQHLVEKILPALEQKKVVISDRFIESSIVYQGYARGIGMKEVEALNLFATQCKYPDITFYIDTPYELAISRMYTSNRDLDRIEIEGSSFHKKVYEGYEIRLKESNMVRIDGSKSIEEAMDSIFNELRRRNYL